MDADIRYAKDAVPILSAGVKDTGAYAFVFGAFLAALYFIRPIGMNFAQNPYLNLLNSIVVLTVLMFITNILPIVYHSKTDGIVSTDGWGALRFATLRDELWNDGRSEAMMISTVVDDGETLTPPFTLSGGICASVEKVECPVI